MRYLTFDEVLELHRLVLGLAAGTVGREEFTGWVRVHLVARSQA